MKKILLPLLLLLLAGWCHATLQVPEIFADHAVLQRSPDTPVWGRAEPGKKITVALGDALAETTAGSDGRWMARLNLLKSPAGPHELKISGDGEFSAKDVLVGEVWLASGQSNMEWILGNSLGAAETVAASTNPMIRQFHVPRRAEDLPVSDIRGRWTIAGPGTTANFSAVGYHFARALQEALGVPVAIINATWGGSACEAWISAEGLDSVPDLAAGRRALDKKIAEAPAEKARYIEQLAFWLRENKRQPPAPPPQAAAFLSTEGWKTIRLPNGGEPLLEPGAVWLRRTLDMPEGAQDRERTLLLGNIEGFESIFWNGEKLSECTPENHPGRDRTVRLTIARDKVRKGANELAIRVESPGGPARLRVSADNFRFGEHMLEGDWEARQEYALPALGEQALASMPRPPEAVPSIQGRPSRLYQGMIAPLIPYGLAGVIWYQGESNASRAAQYRAAFPLLINTWREAWREPDLPFLWCQLTGFMKKDAEPGESAWAELREAQHLTLALPATGQAVILDAGETEDIHPRRKEVPGLRLAAIALANVYGKPVPFRGPEFRKATFEHGQAVVEFDHVGGGLVAAPIPAEEILTSIPPRSRPLVRNRPSSPLEGFALCGADRVWKWADARIEGGKVIVSCPEVPEPVAVRYAWSNNPTANLFNKEGFPAAPFRSDDFPLTTAGSKFGQ